MLNLSHDDVRTFKRARCGFKFTPEWQTIPPGVQCSESWVRKDWNWHAGDRGVLCYILDEQWKDHVGQVMAEEGIVAAARYAAILCLRNVRWLLYRHYISSITNTALWPKDWPAWPHGEPARAEYLRDKNREKANERS
jgi:hypothetical protein